MRKTRLTYTVVFFALLFTEVCIALFVHDGFVRPYVGDMLVTVLICCLCRIIFPRGVPALPLYVFLFALAVEVTQYFDIVKLLGLDGSSFLSALMGRTFSVLDILCYGVGCVAFRLAELITSAFLKHRHGADGNAFEQKEC